MSDAIFMSEFCAEPNYGGAANCSGPAVHIPNTECDDCETLREQIRILREMLEDLETRIKDYDAGEGISISDTNVISAERHPGNTYTKTEVNGLLDDYSKKNETVDVITRNMLVYDVTRADGTSYSVDAKPILPINPTTAPTENGAIWFTT